MLMVKYTPEMAERLTLDMLIVGTVGMVMERVLIKELVTEAVSLLDMTVLHLELQVELSQLQDVIRIIRLQLLVHLKLQDKI